MKKLYAAIDLHSNNSVLVVLDEGDGVVYEKRLPNELVVIGQALAPFREALQGVAVESTYNWYWLVDGLMEAGYTVHLVNTTAVQVYSGLKHTDDEHDARWLAHLLRLGLLPTGYIYPKAWRGLRDVLRKRGHLVRERVRMGLSLQGQIARNTGQCLSGREVEALSDEALQGYTTQSDQALALHSTMAVMRSVREQIQRLERHVEGQVKLRPEYARLMTVPGIGRILAMTIMLEVGAMERFVDVGHFASYARLVKTGRYSNAKLKGYGNGKNGNKYLSWAFMEAAHFAIRFQERIRSYYQRKKAKTHVAIARKAVAHKLARACFHVLKDQVDFDVAKAF